MEKYSGEGNVYFSRSLGRWGVLVFFILSGFLMNYTYWNKTQKNELKDAGFRCKEYKNRIRCLLLEIGIVFQLLKKRGMFLFADIGSYAFLMHGLVLIILAYMLNMF